MCKGMCTHSHHSPALHTLPWTAVTLIWVQNCENRAVLTAVLLRVVFKSQTMVCSSGVIHATLWGLYFLVLVTRTVQGRECSFYLLGFNLLCITITKFQSMIYRKRSIPYQWGIPQISTGTELPWPSPILIAHSYLSSNFISNSSFKLCTILVSEQYRCHCPVPFMQCIFPKAHPRRPCSLPSSPWTSYIHPQKLLLLNFTFIVIKHLSQKYKVTEQPDGIRMLYGSSSSFPSAIFFSIPLPEPRQWEKCLAKLVSCEQHFISFPSSVSFR